MPRVCLVGESETVLRYELLSRETARNALSSYTLSEPFHNALAVETVSLGGSISLLNDLNWYLTRFVETALVLDESVSSDEWLSREMARSIRDDRIAADESREYLMVYGLAYDGDPDEEPDDESPSNREQPDGSDSIQMTDSGERTSGVQSSIQSKPRLVEPMYVTAGDGSIPAYDLREVADTLVVRVTESEFSDD